MILFPAALRLHWQVAFGVSVVLMTLGGASCFGADDSAPARATGNGRVTIVYQDEAIEPANREASRRSGRRACSNEWRSG